MNILGDFEILKASMLMGDFGDVMWKIRSVRDRVNQRYLETGKEVFGDYVKLLDTLKAVISGDAGISDLRASMHSDAIREQLSDVDVERYTDTFLFFLEYSLDRYNVKYPEFNAKRCNDA